MISPLRFLAVVYPVASLSFRTNSNARLAIGITWLVTLLSVRFLLVKLNVDVSIPNCGRELNKGIFGAFLTFYV